MNKQIYHYWNFEKNPNNLDKILILKDNIFYIDCYYEIPYELVPSKSNRLFPVTENNCPSNIQELKNYLAKGNLMYPFWADRCPSSLQIIFSNQK